MDKLIDFRSRLPALILVRVSCAIVALLFIGCVDTAPERPTAPTPVPVNPIEEPQDTSIVGSLPEIDLSNWKVTLPIPRPDGNPLEISPPTILNYATNEDLLPFMYNDSTDASLVFYTYPNVSTTNSSYSRTELREQLTPGSNSNNWTFSEGGKMRGTLSVPEVSTDSDGDFHRIIIMQIHGRLTDQQKNLIGASDNNAPPVLKIYWQHNKVYVRTKQLVDVDVTYEEKLTTDAWEDDDGTYFAETVGTDPFTLEIEASQGSLIVTMNDSESFVYDDIHMQEWGIFENYFKAGNYLVTTDEGAFARVKYYDLEVSHE